MSNDETPRYAAVDAGAFTKTDTEADATDDAFRCPLNGTEAGDEPAGEKHVSNGAPRMLTVPLDPDLVDGAGAVGPEALLGVSEMPHEEPCNPWFSENPLEVVMVLADYCIRMRGAPCERCALACPHNAITFGAGERPVIDRALCTRCGVCEGICDSFATARLPLAALHSRLRRIALRGDEPYITCEACVPAHAEAAESVAVLPTLALLSPEFWALLLAEGTPVVIAGSLEEAFADGRAGTTGEELFAYAVETAERWTGRTFGWQETVPLANDASSEHATGSEKGRRQLLDDLITGVADIASGRYNMRKSRVIQDVRERRERLQARNRVSAAEGPKLNPFMPKGRLNQVLWPKRRLLLEALDALPNMAPRVPILLSRTNDRCNDCLACLPPCPTQARFAHPEEGSLLFDARYCIGCELCAQSCPQDAISFEITDASELL